MKLLILSDVNAPYRVEVFKGLSKKIETVTFFNGKSIKGSVPQWYCQSSDEFEFFVLNNDEALKKYNKCLNNIKDFDAVLCYDPWHKRSRALQRLCIKKKIPYILNADGVVDINKSLLKLLVKSYYVRRAALCFAGCDKAACYFETYGAKKEKIIRHNFTSLFRSDILEKPYMAIEKSDIKASIGLEDKFTFLSVGRLVEVKGFNLLLSAWEKTSQSSQLVIVGEGPLKETLLNIISEKGLKNVEIVGFKDKEVLKKYYDAADVFVMPSRGDVWGLVINEAMASGLPIISSDRCTAANELIKQNVNGLVYGCYEVDKLAECMNFMECNPETVDKMAIKALELIAKYTYEDVISTHIANIMTLMQK